MLPASKSGIVWIDACTKYRKMLTHEFASHCFVAEWEKEQVMFVEYLNIIKPKNIYTHIQINIIMECHTSLKLLGRA